MSDAASSQVFPTPFPACRTAFRPRWAKITCLLVVGYLTMSRSFAYIGLPWINLYIGEIVLVAFVFFGPRTKRGRWLKLALSLRQIQRLKWLLVLFLAYGGFEALRGIAKGYPPFTAARDTAFNYYPIFLFLGIWVGLQDRSLLRYAVRTLASWNAWYGLAYVVFLSRLPLVMPGTAAAASAVPLFSEPYGSGIALLGLLAFEPRLRRVWHLLAMNALVMLWVQVRAEWLGFALGLLMFAWLTKQMRRFVVPCLALALLLAIMYVAKIDLPSPQGRGGRFSVGDLIGRAVAPVNEDAANNLSTGDNSAFYSGTANWRLIWWAAIWENVRSSAALSWVGYGYGYPIGELNPLIEQGTFIQTPHSDFFYALGYSGWIGVALFALFQLELLRLLVRSYQATRQPFGLMCWTALVATSFFEEFFEAPFGAIPFYLFVGMAIASVVLLNGTVRNTENYAGPTSSSALAQI